MGAAAPAPQVAGVDLQAALAALPAPYALALRLAGQSADKAAIAEGAAVPTDSVAALIKVGEAKLAALLATPDPAADADG